MRVLIHVSVPKVRRDLLGLVRQLDVKPYSTATMKVISSGTLDQGPLISYTILVNNFSFRDYLQTGGIPLHDLRANPVSINPPLFPVC